MTEWSQFQDAVPQAVKKILGKKYDADWYQRDARWRDAEHLRLQIVALTPLGRGEVRRKATVPADGTFTERVYSPQRITVQFTFVTQNQELAFSAMPAAEQVMTALRRSDAFDILCAAGVGINQVTPAQVVDFKDDQNRWRSAVVFDVWFNAHVSAIGRTAGGDYVEQVEVKGEVNGVVDAVDLLVDAS